MAESELGPSQHLIRTMDSNDDSDEPALKKHKIDSVISLSHLASLASDVSEVGSGLMAYSHIGDEEEEEVEGGAQEEQTVLVHSSPTDLLVDSDGGMLMNPASHDMGEPSLVDAAKLAGELSDGNQECAILPFNHGGQFATINGQVMQLVQFQDSESPSQLVPNGYKVYQLVQTSAPKAEAIYTLNTNGEIEIVTPKSETSMLGVGEMGLLTSAPAGTGQSNAARFIPIAPQRINNLPHDVALPGWAQKLNDCQKIGKGYRGWVETEIELDFLLTLHKQQTQSFWGTRQSPCPSKPSSRLMWKSQYVPFDGVPFVNSGSRAMVMECQYGPRRKGGTALAKRLEGSSKGDFRQTCPARIYVKKIIKFPQFQVDPLLDKKSLHVAMAKSFQMLKETGSSSSGIERFYVELPLEAAHEFHVDLPAASIPVQCDAPCRLDARVSQRVRDVVASGETRLYVIRKALRRFVEKDLFDGSDGLPPKHDLSFYPTVNDLQNHIHHAIKDIESGRLALTATTVNVDIVATDDLKKALRDDSNGVITHLGSGAEQESTAETITVTLTQNPEQNREHVISRVETHMSDGSTRISTSLNEETAKLLSKLHPKMFTSTNLIRFDRKEEEESDEASFHTAQLLNLQSESPALESDSVFLEPENQGANEELRYTVVVDDSHLADIVHMESVKAEDVVSTLHLTQPEVHLESPA